jgi:hypothetical protein
MNRQFKGQRKTKGKRTIKNIQNTTQKTKYRATRGPKRKQFLLHCDTSRVILVTNQLISHE